VVQKEFDMSKLFARFAKNESGATAIEYGLIAALIAVACIGIWGTVGSSLIARFTEINENLQ
jgi:pilus assembly protein Flp/PilA